AVLGWRTLLSPSLSLTAPGAGLVRLIEVCSVIVVLPVTGLLGATGWLLYSRLLGRLAWMVQGERVVKSEPVAEEKEAPGEAGGVEGGRGGGGARPRRRGGAASPPLSKWRRKRARRSTAWWTSRRRSRPSRRRSAGEPAACRRRPRRGRGGATCRTVRRRPST